jgi:hypothetical protein
MVSRLLVPRQRMHVPVHQHDTDDHPGLTSLPTVAARCRRATGLNEFSIAGNRIHGAIPDEVQNLRYLTRFNIQNTRMFCCGGGQRCMQPRDPACLPTFLTFEDSLVVPPPYISGTTAQANETRANMK